MSYGHANCPKCGEPTNFYPEVGEDESRMLCKDCRIAELRAEVERLKPFADRATRNVEKWGPQDFVSLGLAVCEEAGELAQAILQAQHEGGAPERIKDEAVDLGALCIQVVERYEERTP